MELTLFDFLRMRYVPVSRETRIVDPENEIAFPFPEEKFIGLGKLSPSDFLVFVYVNQYDTSLMCAYEMAQDTVVCHPRMCHESTSMVRPYFVSGCLLFLCRSRNFRENIVWRRGRSDE
jgi:hypothetical protein